MKYFVFAIVSVFVLLSQVKTFAAPVRKPVSKLVSKERVMSISRETYDLHFSAARVVFLLKFQSVTPTFPVDDMPSGSNIWRVTGHVTEVFKGKLSEQKGSAFDALVSIYQGPVLSRPVGFWVNVVPSVGDSWLILSSVEPSNSSVVEILKSNQGTSFKEQQVRPYLPDTK